MGMQQPCVFSRACRGSEGERERGYSDYEVCGTESERCVSRAEGSVENNIRTKPDPRWDGIMEGSHLVATGRNFKIARPASSNHSLSNVRKIDNIGTFF